MLTRVYIDNFRCFVNFEFKPDRKQLLLGRNGSGKSSFLDALLLVRQLAAAGEKIGQYILTQRTRWSSQRQQTCEVEAKLDGKVYSYRLVLEPFGEPPQPRVLSETVYCDQKPIFEFVKGEVHLYNDRFEQKVKYPFDWHRSALATILPRKDNETLTRFRQWFGGMVCFRLNPTNMSGRAEGEDLYPKVDLSNIAAWYRHLIQANPRENAAFLESLRSTLDAFSFFGLEPVGENVRLLVAEFADGSNNVKLGFNELSDGQRCLICLYMILHFILVQGQTVILDEPDNFISLREIQPWLTAVTDALEEKKGQLLVISHHPEIINQWASENGAHFIRSGLGPVRIEPFRGDSSGLVPSELLARGWENE